MPASVQRVFVPLTGAESAHLIAYDVKEKVLEVLLQQQDFREHLTYPCIKYRWKLEVEIDVHPSEPSHLSKQVSDTGEIVVDPKALAVTVVKGSRNCDTREADGQAPDDARSEAGLPIPHVVQTNTGKVDAFDTLLAQKAKRGR